MGNYIPHLTINRRPKRLVDKKEAIRHLIHAAVRMIAAKEDPFAIHQLVQSADKMLIDMAAATGKKLAFNFEDYIKPDMKKRVFEIFRQTYNFFKHAKTDHDENLPVGKIPEMNLLQIAVCVQNYHAIYGESTNHMQLMLAMSRLVFTEGFDPGKDQKIFEVEFDKVKDKSLSGYLGPVIWEQEIPGLPKLIEERDQDLQDNGKFYETTFSDFAKNSG